MLGRFPPLPRNRRSTIPGSRPMTIAQRHTPITSKWPQPASAIGTVGARFTPKAERPASRPDFADRASKGLGLHNPKLLAELLALRADVHRFAAQRWPGVEPPSAEALNARNQHLLDQAAALLGPAKFKRIFGFAPDQKINLVDP